MTGMGKRLEGKAAFITGAASGIGRQSALRFAAEGATIVAQDNAREIVEIPASTLWQGQRSPY